jgi:methylated-DNA-protein-cysteine methyltransferase-like protein
MVERVLRAVELVPRGRVVTYGDLADLVGIGPRLAGRVMGTWGSGVPWWRVVNAAGDLPEFHLRHARQHWLEEGITLKPSGRGCRIRQHRADLPLLADAWERAVADLPPLSRLSSDTSLPPAAPDEPPAAPAPQGWGGRIRA